MVQQTKRSMLKASLLLPFYLSACGGSGKGTTGSSSSQSSSSLHSATSSSSTSSVSSSASSADTSLWGSTTWNETPSYGQVSSLQSFADFAAVTLPPNNTYTLRLPVGCNTASSSACASGGETVNLTPYYLGKYLVTNANWKAYCDAANIATFPTYWSSGQYPASKEKHPVFFVSYTQAIAYCAWLTTYLNNGYTFYIPSEAEWEWAALGANSTYIYPWGKSANISYSSATAALSSNFNCNAVCSAFVLNSGMTTLSYYNDTQIVQGTGYDASADTGVLNQILSLTSTGGANGWQYDSSSVSATNYSGNADFANSDQFKRLVYTWGGYSSTVGSYEAGKSWCGCYDMSGNAFEWTSTTGLAANGAEAGLTVNIVRGGSWYSTSGSGSCIMRGEGRSAGGSFNSIGFRVAARLT